MKTLYLVRHAKAVKKNTLPDFTCTLTSEGRDQASALGTYWKSRRYGVDFAMCSAAVRAEQTFEFILPNLGTDNTLVSNNFYNIDEDEMLHYIQKCGKQYNKLLFVGHNPGVGFFAMKMAKEPPEAMLSRYSPGSLCIFQIDLDDWSKLDWHMGDVTDYWAPPK